MNTKLFVVIAEHGESHLTWIDLRAAFRSRAEAEEFVKQNSSTDPEAELRIDEVEFREA